MGRHVLGRRTAAPAAAVLLCILLAGGCASSGQNVADTPSTSSRSDEVVPPLPEADQRTLHAAQMKLVARCMKDAGFEFEETSFDEIKASDDRAVEIAAGASRRDEVEKDHTLARKIGWGIDPDTAPTPEPAEDVQPPAGPDDRARQEALFGTRYEKVRTAQPHVEDVSVFPMAMPMLAGPGSIASVMLLTARARGIEETGVILAALVVVMVLSFVALVAARPIIRVLGAQVEAVITRLLGVLLAALAAQFVIDGIQAQF